MNHPLEFLVGTLDMNFLFSAIFYFSLAFSCLAFFFIVWDLPITWFSIPPNALPTISPICAIWMEDLDLLEIVKIWVPSSLNDSFDVYFDVGIFIWAFLISNIFGSKFVSSCWLYSVLRGIKNSYESMKTRRYFFEICSRESQTKGASHPCFKIMDSFNLGSPTWKPPLLIGLSASGSYLWYSILVSELFTIVNSFTDGSSKIIRMVALLSVGF